MNDIFWHVSNDQEPHNTIMKWMVDNVRNHTCASYLANEAIDKFNLDDEQTWVWDMAQDVWDVTRDLESQNKYAK